MKKRYLLPLLMAIGILGITGTASAHDSYRPAHYGHHYKGHGYRDYRHDRRHYYHGHRHHARCGHRGYYHNRYRHDHYHDNAWIQFGLRLH